MELPIGMITSVPGKINNLKLAPHNGLIPVIEAVMNSIQAIRELQKKDKGYAGEIEIEVIRQEETISHENVHTLIESVRITDNGIGFNTDNRNSFHKAESTYKQNIGGKGVGRFTWLKVFSFAEIFSQYIEDGKKYKYRCKFVPKDDPFEFDHNEEANSFDDFKTTVFLQSSIEDFKSALSISTEDLIFKIGSNILPVLVSKDCPKILLTESKGGKLESFNLNSIFKSSYILDNRSSPFKVRDEDFQVDAMILKNKVPNFFNTLNLFGHDRLVSSAPLKDRGVDFADSIFSIDLNSPKEKVSIFAMVSSRFLDSAVNQERTAFNLPNKRTDENTLIISLDEIEESSFDVIKELFHRELDVIRDKKSAKLELLVKNRFPQFRIILNRHPDFIDDLNLNSSDSEVEHQLMEIKTKFSIEAKKKAKKVLDKKRIRDEEQYNRLFDESIQELSDISKSSLIDYVVHRRVIIELFEKSLEMRENGKFDYEKHIHNLIFQTRTNSDSLDYDEQNLWLIDEKLSFHKYLSSDESIETKRERPDILATLFDKSLAYSSETIESPVNSIVIIEFKRPGRDNFSLDDNPFIQVVKYIEKLKANKAKTPKGRPITVSPSCRFYCYIVTDLNEDSKALAKNHFGYRDSPDGMGLFLVNTNLNMYSEVITFNKLLGDAKQRNRVLFEKLDLD